MVTGVWFEISYIAVPVIGYSLSGYPPYILQPRNIWLMAILKSGALISLTKSVGGLNFYRADGTQYVRSKPVLPTGYVPTVNQLLARQLFGLASTNIDRISLLAQMLGLNYSLVNKNATKTYRDVALGFMMRYLCRDADGKPYSFEVKEAMAARLEAAPVPMIGAMVPLSFQNAIPWPVGVNFVSDSTETQIVITEEGWRYWYYQLLEIGYYPKQDSQPTVLWGSIDAGAGLVGPWQKSVGLLSSSSYVTNIHPGFIELAERQIELWQWSLAYEMDPAYYDGLSGLYVCTTPVIVHRTA